MDDASASSYIFDIFFSSMVETIEGMFKGQQDLSNYTITDKFNQNCTDDMDCEDIALFCNLTIKRCQCAVFHTRKQFCELQVSNLTDWIKKNGTDNSWEVNPYISPYHMSWHIISVIVLSCVCLILCALYVCFGNEKEKITGVLCKEKKEEPCSINIEHIDCKVNHLQVQQVH